MKTNLRIEILAAAILGTGLMMPFGSRSQSSQAPVATNAVSQLQSAQTEQAEVIQKLLGRLEQLEKARVEESQRADFTEKAHQAELRQPRTRIEDLEGKITSVVSATNVPTAQELDQKIRVLARNDELAKEAAEARAKEAPKVSVGSGGFVLSSADTNFVLKLRGLVQTDWRTFLDDSPYSEGSDGFLVRRARPIIEGTVFRDFDFLLTTDFAGSSATLIDAWLNYRYRPEFQLRIGKMRGPVGLENLQSDSVGPFNERSLANGPAAPVPPGTVTAQDEKAFFTRVQLAL